MKNKKNVFRFGSMLAEGNRSVRKKPWVGKKTYHTKKFIFRSRTKPYVKFSFICPPGKKPYVKYPCLFPPGKISIPSSPPYTSDIDASDAGEQIAYILHSEKTIFRWSQTAGSRCRTQMKCIIYLVQENIRRITKTA